MLIRADNSAKGPGPVVIRGGQVLGSTHVAYSFLKLGPNSDTLLYVSLSCVTNGVIIIHDVRHRLRLVSISPDNRPLGGVSLGSMGKGSMGKRVAFTTVIPVRICGALRIPRRQRQLARVHRLVVKNKTVSTSLRGRLRTLPNGVTV